MNTTPKDALREARSTVDYDPSPAVAYAEIAQAEQLTRIADAVEELVTVVRAALVVASVEPVEVASVDPVDLAAEVRAIVDDIVANRKADS